jgi:hypothetical protein
MIARKPTSGKIWGAAGKQDYPGEQFSETLGVWRGDGRRLRFTVIFQNFSVA